MTSKSPSKMFCAKFVSVDKYLETALRIYEMNLRLDKGAMYLPMCRV